MKRAMFIVVSIFLLIFLLGCSSGNEIDPLLLGEGDCQPPCWNSITPGQTTASEALDRIVKDTEKVKYSTYETDIYVTYEAKRFIKILPNENLIFVKILSDDQGVVSYIGYDLDNTHLDQIISVFGEPKFIECHLTSGGGVFNLFYPERGISFLGPAKRNLSYDLWIITPETEVTLVSYTSPDLQGDAFFNYVFGDNSDLVRNGIVLWDGYKKYPFQLKE